MDSLWFVVIVIGILVTLYAFLSSVFCVSRKIKLAMCVMLVMMLPTVYVSHFHMLGKDKPAELSLLENKAEISIRDIYISRENPARIYMLIQESGGIPEYVSLPYSVQLYDLLRNAAAQNRRTGQQLTIKDWSKFTETIRDFQIQRNTDVFKNMVNDVGSSVFGQDVMNGIFNSIGMDVPWIFNRYQSNSVMTEELKNHVSTQIYPVKD